ncbi:hypothetical protein EDWATA_01673 [Edwardsiella tarda ATCC 23685]|uniref:Uncharacterized protein n=1 Tax=Edwardsiella tarda ATCC 23685 TaxID=500638 RepID=D4F4K0_EDWTA|nr:hypothetical protein EDWATA_01673 [Edwardsiella tarda ATCC 23685]
MFVFSLFFVRPHNSAGKKTANDFFFLRNPLQRGAICYYAPRFR